MAKLLMAEFLPSNCGDRIPIWPVWKLKKMLKSSLQSADDCNFLLAIDGIDELQDSEMTASDLVSFLCDVQKPSNIKLCISSRPEIEIARECSSFLKAQLADINREDIETFARAKLDALPQLDQKSLIVNEICRRVDGIFLWAAFAVQEIYDGYQMTPRDTTSELLKRLDRMGDKLEDAVSYMVRRIKSPHRQSLAFYLQAMRIWKRSGVQDRMSVALIAAAHVRGPLNDFAAACQKEARDLQCFSRGLIEVSDNKRSSVDTHPGQSMGVASADKKELARGMPLEAWMKCYGVAGFLVNHRHKLDGENGPHLILRSKPEGGAWIAVVEDDSIRVVLDHCLLFVDLIHRSVYDFFFPPPHELCTKEAAELIGSEEEPSALARLEDGVHKLFWAMPVPFEPAKEQIDLAKELASRIGNIVNFTARTHHSNHERLEILRQLRYDVWQELLRSFVRKPLLGFREHLPGDIFSSITLNGRLQLLHDDGGTCRTGFQGFPRKLDIDEIQHIELNAPHEYAKNLATFEAGFWTACSLHTCLRDYLYAHLTTAHRSRTGRLTLLRILADERISAQYGEGPRGLVKHLLNALTCWRKAETSNSFSPSLHTSMWQWIPKSELIYEKEAYGIRDDTNPFRHARPILRTGRWDWVSSSKPKDIGAAVWRILAELIHKHCQDLDSIIFSRVNDGLYDDKLIKIRPWDVWVAMDIEHEPTDSGPRTRNDRVAKKQTKILCSALSVCNAIVSSSGKREEDLSRFPAHIIYRIIHLYDYDLSWQEITHPKYMADHLQSPENDISDDIKPQAHFLHDVKPPIELWNIVDLVSFHLNDIRLPALNDSQHSHLIQSIRQSAVLNQAQQDTMVEGLDLMRPKGFDSSRVKR